MRTELYLLSAALIFFEDVVSKQPGLVSTNFHKSLDGTRILNYAQWESKEDWENSISNKEVTSYDKHPFKYGKPHVH